MMVDNNGSHERGTSAADFRRRLCGIAVSEEGGGCLSEDAVENGVESKIYETGMKGKCD